MSTQNNRQDAGLSEKHSAEHSSQNKISHTKADTGPKHKHSSHFTAIQNAGGEQPLYLAAFQPRKPSRFALAFVGNSLYELGFATEYRLVQVGRALRGVAMTLGQVVLWLLQVLLGWILAFARDVWQDFTSPFRHFRQQRQQLENLRQHGVKFGYGQTQVPGLARVRVKASLRFIAVLIAFLLPIASGVALVATVVNVVNMQYALAVEIDGQVIGYVADQTVVESAKSLLRDRISLADNQEKSDWQLNPTYTIARASSYTTTPQLVNEILRIGSKNPGDIMPAAGLYTSDNRLFAVTENGEKLKQYLDDYLQQQQALVDAQGVSDEESVTVSYVSGLSCDPSSEEVFFSSSVLSWEEMLEELNSNLSEAEYSVADGAKTLAEIAVENGIAQEVLLQRNAQFAEEGIEFVPEAGTSVKLKNAQPLMQIQEVHRRKAVEEIPYKTVEVENAERAFGTRLPVQSGAPGLQEVVDDYIYIEGEEQGRVRVETTVLEPAVDKIVEVGTNQQTLVGLDEFMFPVPSSVWSSRGISSYHRGMDINDKTGAPIFASQTGTVVTAGWHYSYGYHVVINHPNGMTTLYAHCSQLYVEEGQQVVQGELIGAVGSTGNSSGPHLHLEFQKNGALFDPMDYITPPPGYRLGRG